MTTLSGWEIRRRKIDGDTETWITVFDCNTGEALSFNTKPNALAFLKKFTAYQKPRPVAADLRVVAVYKVAETDL